MFGQESVDDLEGVAESRIGRGGNSRHFGYVRVLFATSIPTRLDVGWVRCVRCRAPVQALQEGAETVRRVGEVGLG